VPRDGHAVLAGEGGGGGGGAPVMRCRQAPMRTPPARDSVTPAVRSLRRCSYTKLSDPLSRSKPQWRRCAPRT
jgi:hypothetical protein